MYQFVHDFGHFISNTVARAALDELRLFDHIHLTPWGQSTWDWTDPETGVFYPATFNYMACLAGVRRSDSVNFAVQIILDSQYYRN